MSDAIRRNVQRCRAEAQRWSDRAAMHAAAGDHERAASARYGAAVHASDADRIEAEIEAKYASDS